MGVAMRGYVAAFFGYVIVTFILAFVWHLVLFKPLYDELGMFTRQEPIIALGLSSMLIQAAVFSYLFPLVYRDGSPARCGLILGLLLGAFMGSNAVLAEAGKNEVTSIPTWIALESAFYLLHGALAGLAVGYLHGRFRF